jgi:hypothetical protein
VSLLPAVCAHCHRPVETLDAAFCDAHWRLLDSETRRRIVRERNKARTAGKATRALLMAVLGARKSLAASLASKEALGGEL